MFQHRGLSAFQRVKNNSPQYRRQGISASSSVLKLPRVRELAQAVANQLCQGHFPTFRLSLGMGQFIGFQPCRDGGRGPTGTGLIGRCSHLKSCV